VSFPGESLNIDSIMRKGERTMKDLSDGSMYTDNITGKSLSIDNITSQSLYTDRLYITNESLFALNITDKRTGNITSESQYTDSIPNESQYTENTSSVSIYTELICFDLARHWTLPLGVFFIGQHTRDNLCETGIYVSAIHMGSIAQLDGRLNPGDVILEINDIDIEGMSNSDALMTIQNAIRKAGLLRMLVGRYYVDFPSVNEPVPLQCLSVITSWRTGQIRKWMRLETWSYSQYSKHDYIDMIIVFWLLRTIDCIVFIIVCLLSTIDYIDCLYYCLPLITLDCIDCIIVSLLSNIHKITFYLSISMMDHNS